MPIVECVICGNKLKRTNYQLKHHKPCCSDECRIAHFKKLNPVPWNKGKTGVYSKEVLDNMSKAKQADFKIEDAIKLYLDNKSLKEVGAILGCSSSAVRRRLKPLGILKDRGWKKRGSKLSIKTRLKISEYQKMRFGNPKEREKLKGKNNPFYGRKHKPETIEAMKKKLSKLLSGDKNPQWRGGLSFEEYGFYFTDTLKYEIRKRDNFKCQLCGMSEIFCSSSLIVHHKDYNKNNKENNLISLCKSCHMKTNFNRNKWINYFSNMEDIIYDNK